MSECNDKAESIFYTPSEREIYFRQHIAEMDHYSIMQEMYERGRAEGYKEGFEEAFQETFEKAFEKAFEEDFLEIEDRVKVQRSIVKVALQSGLDKELIQKYTGMDWEQLKKLLDVSS
ncbi:MAG: hypothetical protein ACOX4A_03910 [Saccharofermentanales bacterium]|jgi:flagellar biosynthesis/type III secretory pathway protein FliH